MNEIELLDKVGRLSLLPNKEYATVNQVASYYEVSKKAIDTIMLRNKNKFEEDGIKVLIGEELKHLKKIIFYYNKGCIGKRTASLIIIPKKIILKIAFYLTESEVAKAVRNELLKDNPELYYELSQENQLRFKKYETEIKNYLEFSFGKKNIKYQIACGKYKLDFIICDLIHIEVDENGHNDYDKEKEEKRADYILKNTNYYTIRYNPQQQKPYELMHNIILLFDNIGYPEELLKIA